MARVDLYLLEKDEMGTVTKPTFSNAEPYTFRAVPQGAGDLAEIPKILGATAGWNQLQAMTSSSTSASGVMFTKNADGSITVSGTATANATKPLVYTPIPAGHKVLILGTTTEGQPTYQTSGENKTGSYIHNALESDYFRLRVQNGMTVDATIFVNIIDLTLMFGSTIADYIYSLEQATAGAGVAWVKRYIPNDYYPYHEPSLESVNVSAHEMRDADNNIIATYPLDSSLTLRGLFKLDANNNLYADGDVYESDGTVTRKYGLRAYQSGDESLTNAITDGTNTVYELATPTTESAEPYTNPQIVDEHGTERYVDAQNREWEVPVYAPEDYREIVRTGISLKLIEE